VDEFNFLFTFYGLLLGLALVNVTMGLADLWRGREDIRLGICGAMLALSILSFAVSQWYLAWGNRQALTVGPWQLLVCLGVTLPFVFVSQAMFPKQTDRWASLDDYYLEHRKVLLIALSVSPAVSVVSNVLLFRGTVTQSDVLRVAFTILVPIALTWSRNRWVHAAGLLVVSLFYLLVRLFGILG
jgi:hypothetical protein